MILIVVTCLVILLLGWFFIRTRKPKNFPPGPPRLPIVGSFPYMMGSGDSPCLLYGISDQVIKINNFYLNNFKSKVVLWNSNEG